MALGALAVGDPQVSSRGAVVVHGRGPCHWYGGAWGLAELVKGFLFEIQPHEPAVYAGVLAILAATGLLAAFLPARRAAGVDPLVRIPNGVRPSGPLQS